MACIAHLTLNWLAGCCSFAAVTDQATHWSCQRLMVTDQQAEADYAQLTGLVG